MYKCTFKYFLTFYMVHGAYTSGRFAVLSVYRRTRDMVCYCKSTHSFLYSVFHADSANTTTGGCARCGLLRCELLRSEPQQTRASTAINKQQTITMVVITTHCVSSESSAVGGSGVGGDGGGGGEGGGGVGGGGGEGSACSAVEVNDRTVTLRMFEAVSAVNVLSISVFSALASSSDPEVVEIVMSTIVEPEESDSSIAFVDIATASANFCRNGIGKNRWIGSSMTTMTLTLLPRLLKLRLHREQRSGQCAPSSKPQTVLVNTLL